MPQPYEVSILIIFNLQVKILTFNDSKNLIRVTQLEMKNLAFKFQFLNFSESGTLPTTFSSKLLQCLVPPLVHPAPLFGFLGSFLPLLLEWKRCVFSRLCFAPPWAQRQDSIGIPRSVNERLEAKEGRPPLLCQGSVQPMPTLLFIEASSWGDLDFLSAGACFSKQKQLYILKSIFLIPKRQIVNQRPRAQKSRLFSCVLTQSAPRWINKCF